MRRAGRITDARYALARRWAAARIAWDTLCLWFHEGEATLPSRAERPPMNAADREMLDRMARDYINNGGVG